VLQYERGRALVSAGRAGEALADLAEASAEARAHGRDTIYLAYFLAEAYYATGGYEEAWDCVNDLPDRLYKWRENGVLAESWIADAAQLLLARVYARLGDGGRARAGLAVLAERAADPDLARLAQDPVAALADTRSDG
jgi:thioredoxin-like negative regulator of GroEL